MSSKKNKKLRDGFRFQYRLDPITGEVLDYKSGSFVRTGVFRSKEIVRSLYKQYLSMLGV